MRVKTEFKKISVTKSVHEQLIKDRNDFSKVIGGKFSISDTINEYKKIINNFKK